MIVSSTDKDFIDVLGTLPGGIKRPPAYRSTRYSVIMTTWNFVLNIGFNFCFVREFGIMTCEKYISGGRYACI